jgi:predicted nucleic acid-binding protein
METVYIETTIPSYLVSEPSRDVVIIGHQQLTQNWWENEKKKYELFISEIVIEEISRGNPHYSKQRLEIIKDAKLLILDDNITKIAENYMQNFNFPEKLLRDVFHVAYAVYYEIDYLLTWNCKHIANAHFKKQLEIFNNKEGYKTPEICTPEELF